MKYQREAKRDSDKQYINLQSYTLVIGRHCCSTVRLSRFTSMDLFCLNLQYQCLSLLLPICKITEYDFYKMLVLQCMQLLPDKICVLFALHLSNILYFLSFTHITFHSAEHVNTWLLLGFIPSVSVILGQD